MKVAMDAAKLRARGRDIVDLGPGEPDFPTPRNVKQAAVQAINDNFTRYTAAGGTLELREAVCERHALDFGTAYTPSECVISCGGKHAIFGAIQSLIDPGDEVIIPVPYWVTYADVVAYSGGICVFADTDPRAGFALTAEIIEKCITAETRAIIVNSPCNPSGYAIPPEEFQKIYRLTSKRGIWLITDECYSHLVFDGMPYSVASVAGARSSVIVAGSLSKSYSMTGWRIGYALAPPSVIAAMARLQSHSTSNPNSVAQKAAVEALRGDQVFVGEMLAEYRLRRDFALERLRRIPLVRCHEPKGAFYLYPDISAFFGRKRIHSTMQLAEQLLEDAGVAVVPGEAFGTRDHIRITFAVSMRDLERGIDRLSRFLLELME
jgi:aspartate aminotransferase